MKIIRNNSELNIRNLNTIPGRINPKYLEVTKSKGLEANVYIARIWRCKISSRKRNKNTILIKL